jgi:hypothetical protein
MVNKPEESEFMQAFRGLHSDHADLFAALEEYDRTGKLRKIKQGESRG